MNLKKANIALVFDWMTTPGGAERVNLQLHKMFPDAPIFTSIFNPDSISGFEKARIYTSFIQNLPFARTKHQFYLNLMPYAYELFDLSEFDIVISSSHACAKGVITKPETLHICYCHTPMRYAWDNWHSYINEYKMNRFVKRFAKKRMHKIRMWDRLSAERVDYFIANGNTTKNRILKYYNKPSTVIHPGIKIEKFQKSDHVSNYFLAVGRLIPYKRFDLIVETFNKIGLPLKIVGTGNSESQLRRSANENIEFLGQVTDKTLAKLYSECQALIFPQLEDFGITPLESMASGRPVIAYGKGGALDTIIEKKTGIYFNKQTPQKLKEAIDFYLDNKKLFKKDDIISHAHQFDQKNFQDKIYRYVREKWELWQNKMD